MPADGSASTKCASARYSDRHGTDVDAAGARSRAMDPDESTIHSSYKSCSEKCSRGANQAYPTSLSRFAARDSLVTPETPPDRNPLRSSTLGRVRAFFIPGKNKQIEMRRMPSAAKCNVSLTRNSCASTAGLSQPSLSLPRTAAPPQVLASNSTSVALHIVPDQNWLSMWRIALPDGRSSGMLNLTRAKDVLRSAKRFSRHS